MFGFGGRNKDVDVDEMAIEQRVQDALSRLQSGAEPGLENAAASLTPAAAGPDAAGPVTPSGATADPAVDYVMEALRADGILIERATVTRILALGREFADKTTR